ncbi:hypothetical protein BCR37DRAFT_261327 [Protomyces lactucae-debilis]|uniref:G-protein coupled receptors family 1 profile domain-containing protein n=1 Tax=Protomyces lactucae-debilis TaxID=2754530 RepID=A0A1Y2FJV3_PROLT|nr:uncharacterized protein BCR37DRAFT_261327 [Protomyces lactucae-debilis]ORY84252.1 hypothetical protein BCR37DRAFT_261327 [Protomyces lactucae-debilis]
MARQENSALSALAQGAPWTKQHPLPSPFTWSTIPDDRLRIMKILAIIASCSTAISVLLIIQLVSQHHQGRSNIPWSRMMKPSTPKAQVIWLFMHFFAAQMIQCVGWLFSIVYVAKGSVQTPSAICSAQALLQTMGTYMSQSSASAIAVHSALVIVRLRVVSLVTFWCLLASVWTFTLVLGLIVPIIMDYFYPVPYLAFWDISCFINKLYFVQITWLFNLPFLLHLSITLICYPIISVRLTRQLRFLRAFAERSPAGLDQTRDDDAIRTSRKLLIFPLAFVLGNLPLIFIIVFTLAAPPWIYNEFWPMAIAACFIALLPLVNTLIYFFATPLFKSSPIGQSATTGSCSRPDDALALNLDPNVELHDSLPPKTEQVVFRSTQSDSCRNNVLSKSVGIGQYDDGYAGMSPSMSVPSPVWPIR